MYLVMCVYATLFRLDERDDGVVLLINNNNNGGSRISRSTNQWCYLLGVQCRTPEYTI